MFPLIGPCGGKTTGQVMLATFFENLGWKVFRSPEVATILLGHVIPLSRSRLSFICFPEQENSRISYIPNFRQISLQRRSEIQRTHARIRYLRFLPAQNSRNVSRTSQKLVRKQISISLNDAFLVN